MVDAVRDRVDALYDTFAYEDLLRRLGSVGAQRAIKAKADLAVFTPAVSTEGAS